MKRGFTLIELITTFALSAVIIIILINVTIIMKNIYNDYDSKTKSLILQANLSRDLNSKFKSLAFYNYTTCSEGETCYNFTFVDGTTSRLVINSLYIKFNDRIYYLDKNSEVNNPTIDIISPDIYNPDTTKNDKILVINIPIKNKLYPNDDFGINLVHQYNSYLMPENISN